MAVDRPAPPARVERPDRPQSRGDELTIQRRQAEENARLLAESLKPPAPIPVPDEKLIKRYAKRQELLAARRRASRANVRLSERSSVGPGPGPLGA